MFFIHENKSSSCLEHTSQPLSSEVNPPLYSILLDACSQKFSNFVGLAISTDLALSISLILSTDLAISNDLVLSTNLAPSMSLLLSTDIVLSIETALFNVLHEFISVSGLIEGVVPQDDGPAEQADAESGDCSGIIGVIVSLLTMMLLEDPVSSSISYVATMFSKDVDCMTIGRRTLYPIIS